MKSVKLRIVLFGILAALLIAYLSMVFSYPVREYTDMTRERFNSFYALPDDTLEGVMIGTSGAGRYWLPAQAWKESGITVYGLTTGNQPLFFIKYYIEEALKSQDPKVIIVDLRAVLQEPAEISDSDIRRTTDNMRLSRTRIEATKGILEYLRDVEGSPIDPDDSSYFFHLAKYHSGWKDLKPQAWYKLYSKSEYMGYLAGREFSFETRPEVRTEVTTETMPLDPTVESVLADLLDYCKTLDTPVVFMTTPYSVAPDLQKKLNYAFEMIEESGFDTYNFNTDEMYDALEWNFNGDMYNHGHANFAGAVKFTRYLSQILIDKYGCEDRRLDADQSKFEAWDEAYDNTMERVKHYTPEYYEENFA